MCILRGMADRVFTAPTSKYLCQLLPKIMKKIGHLQELRPDLVLAAWPSFVGERIASMTAPVSFINGILTIKVRNSSLLSLLAQHEKLRLLRVFREKFPHVKIQDIRFYIG